MIRISLENEALREKAARIAHRAMYGTEGYDDAPPEVKDRWRALASAVMAFYRVEQERERKLLVDAGQMALPRKPGRPPVYPFAELDIGQSFSVARDDKGMCPFNQVYSSRHYWEHKLGRVYQIKANAEGLTVTRAS